MESQTQSPIKKQDSVSKKDLGSSTKKKKERENRNSISTSDFVHEWSQKNEFVIVTVFVGAGHDNRTVTVSTDDQELILLFMDGRKLQISLYERIVPDTISYTFKNYRCNIKLLKHDPNIEWPSLDIRNTLPEKSINKLKGNSVTVTKGKETSEEAMEETSSNRNVVKVIEPRTNFVERHGDPTVLIFLYVSNINKETLLLRFFANMFTVFFSTSDSNFLKNYPDVDETTVFEWYLQTKGEIIASQCSYRVSGANLELKLKKTSNELWESPSLAPQITDNSVVMKNTWVPAIKNDSKKNSNIPPAPPAPPVFHEIKKPTSLVSPSSKPLSDPSNVAGFSLSSSIGNDVGSGTALCPRGMTGLDNIGNTCFMNSVLQCLVNTCELRDYFLEYNFQQDLNKENPLGMGGKLAISFAVLMKHLWSGTTRSFAPSKLKGVMSLKANQFSGFAQHDAQEFMVELLDGLHEDLNRIKKKPYIAEPPDLDGWLDNEAAEESWRLHKMRNDSVIDDLFKGQFKSTLRCHECDKISVKFDEFCCLSVPIPKDQKKIQVVFFWREKSKRPKKFIIKVSADALVEDLKQQLSLHTCVPPNAIQVMEILKFKIHKIFGKCSTLSSVVSLDILMAFEVLTEQEAGEPVVELAVTQRMTLPNPPNKCAVCNRPPAPGTKLKRCTRCYRVGYCDTSCQKSHWHNHKPHCKLVPEPVGSPFILSLPESSVTYSNLSQMAENYASYSVDIFQPPVAQTQNSRRRHGSTSSGDLSSDAEEMEVDSEGSGEARECDMESGAYSGEDRAEADWPLSGGASGGPSGASFSSGRTGRMHSSGSISSNSSGVEEIPKLSSSPKGKAATPQRTLTPATRLFTLRPVNMRAQNMAPPQGEVFSDNGSEPLDLRDVQFLAMDWCTNERLPVHCFVQNKEIDCEVEQEESVQRSKHTTLEACIDLFTQPENLSEGDSWRCPRCKKPVEATKQMSLWRLPSVLIIQLKRFSFKYVLYSDKIDKYVQYPIRSLEVGPFLSEGSPEGTAIYDLYGVINHMGRLLGGHYTAYCRTVDEVDSRQSEIDWRLCDDSRVSWVQEARVVHEQAYLLLYRRRGYTFQIQRSVPSPVSPRKAGVADESNSDDDDAFEPMVEQSEEAGAKSHSLLEPMEESTPLSLSSASQISSSGSSEPPSTVQEELD